MLSSSSTRPRRPALQHIAFVIGLDKIFVPIKEGKVVVAKGRGGQIYSVAMTSSDTASDSTIVTDPAPFTSESINSRQYVFYSPSVWTLEEVSTHCHDTFLSTELLYIVHREGRYGN